MDISLENKFTESGKIENPGKSYYLKLASTVVADFNKDGANTDTDGVWRESQLKNELQTIINAYRYDFNLGYQTGMNIDRP